jgi:hypothetical protein
MLNYMTAHTEHLLPPALDPELPRLAASAALEVDLLINNPTGEVSFKALKRLFDRLPETPLSDSSDKVALGLIDPLSQDLYRKALARSLSDNVKTQSLVELKRATDALIQTRGEREEVKNQTVHLTDIRDFCLALSNYAAASRGNRFGAGRRGSPYRV